MGYGVYSYDIVDNPKITVNGFNVVSIRYYSDYNRIEFSTNAPTNMTSSGDAALTKTSIGFSSAEPHAPSSDIIEYHFEIPMEEDGLFIEPAYYGTLEGDFSKEYSAIVALSEKIGVFKNGFYTITEGGSPLTNPKITVNGFNVTEIRSAPSYERIEFSTDAPYNGSSSGDGTITKTAIDFSAAEPHAPKPEELEVLTYAFNIPMEETTDLFGELMFVGTLEGDFADIGHRLNETAKKYGSYDESENVAFLADVTHFNVTVNGYEVGYLDCNISQGYITMGFQNLGMLDGGEVQAYLYDTNIQVVLPAAWNPEYPSNKPLYIEAAQNITIKFGNEYEYSTDNSTWTKANSSTTIAAAKGTKTYFRASDLTATSASGIGKFTISGGCNLGGNIMSMLYGDDYFGKTALTQTHCFYRIFAEQKNIIDASLLVLPATVLTDSCYYSMFDTCTRLTYGPALPATTLVIKCYTKMFNQCGSLISTPELPATKLAESCYNNMFAHCYSLTNAPELKATKLADLCYSNMFNTCKNLINAPAILPATTLTTYCYNNMFHQCYNLENAPILPALTLAADCCRQMFKSCSKIDYIKAMFLTAPSYTDTSDWLSGVADKGTFVKNAKATWTVSYNNGSTVPNGWTIQTASE